ncbi:Clp protease N-terminal domain-containing protein [Actinomycetospora sp. CA-053990]|uniref:Clp protease N-terminal domain-containing protein n=1 Tax=Actinomycetospora sp. CA-053990 TaxID=3239891 RepID=UPI003D90BAC5
MARALIDDARRWPGWPRAAEHAAGRGRERVGTEHLLLALVHGPPGPARAALSSVGVVTSVVHRAFEAISGPNGARAGVAVTPQPLEPCAARPAPALPRSWSRRARDRRRCRPGAPRAAPTPRRTRAGQRPA